MSNSMKAVIALLVLCFAGAAILLFRSSAQDHGGALVGGPFQLVDQNGQTRTDKDFLGKPTLVFFGYTHCPDVCPTTLSQLTEVFHALGPDAKIAGAFITVDPERDTPALMKDYLSSFDPRIVGLSGPRPAIDAAIRAYRVYAKKVPGQNGEYTMDHTALVYLMDKNGRFVSAFNLDRPPAEAAAELRKYL
ncbi:MAG: SCO family protein [Hyphomicrobiales bacterium]|nr:SCO family protein [Hyphomicrobiales bacterium]